MGAEGLRVTTEVLELVEEDLPVEDAWLGGSRVLRLERLRRVEGRPLASGPACPWSGARGWRLPNSPTPRCTRY